MENAKLRHVVLLGFKDSTKPAEVDEIVRRFCALQSLVPGIEMLEWGQNNSPEELNQGLSHCFTLTFGSENDRDAYLPHPDHAAFADWVGKWVENVTVLDYWAKSGAGEI